MQLGGDRPCRLDCASLDVFIPGCAGGATDSLLHPALSCAIIEQRPERKRPLECRARQIGSSRREKDISKCRLRVCLETQLARPSVDPYGRLQRGSRLVVTPQPEQGCAQAVQDQALVNAVTKLPAQAERGLILPKRLTIVSVFPPQEAERIPERNFPAMVVGGNRAGQGILVFLDRRVASAKASRAPRNSFESQSFTRRVTRTFAAVTNQLPYPLSLLMPAAALQRLSQSLPENGLRIQILQLGEQCRCLGQWRYRFGVASQSDQNFAERAQ